MRVFVSPSQDGNVEETMETRRDLKCLLCKKSSSWNDVFSHLSSTINWFQYGNMKVTSTQTIQIYSHGHLITWFYISVEVYDQLWFSSTNSDPNVPLSLSSWAGEVVLRFCKQHSSFLMIKWNEIKETLSLEYMIESSFQDCDLYSGPCHIG